MSVLKETAIAVQFLALLLFVSHTFLGPDESYRKLTIGPTSWIGAVTVPAERFLSKSPINGSASGVNVGSVPSERVSVGEITPDARIRSVFGQFLPSRRRPTT